MITVQILSLSSGAHAAADVGSLGILQFLKVPRLEVVHLGGAAEGLSEGQKDLADHACVFEQLRTFALSPARSALLLQEADGYLARHIACIAANRSAAQVQDDSRAAF